MFFFLLVENIYYSHITCTCSYTHTHTYTQKCMLPGYYTSTPLTRKQQQNITTLTEQTSFLQTKGKVFFFFFSFSYLPTAEQTNTQTHSHKHSLPLVWLAAGRTFLLWEHVQPKSKKKQIYKK